MELLEHIQAERSELADLLEDLTAEEPAHPSLCKGWSVRDVAAHAVSYDRINPLTYFVLFLATGVSVDRGVTSHD